MTNNKTKNCSAYSSQTRATAKQNTAYLQSKA